MIKKASLMSSVAVTGFSTSLHHCGASSRDLVIMFYTLLVLLWQYKVRCPRTAAYLFASGTYTGSDVGERYVRRASLVSLILFCLRASFHVPVATPSVLSTQNLGTGLLLVQANSSLHSCFALAALMDVSTSLNLKTASPSFRFFYFPF